MGQARLLLGVSIFWLALSLLFDGFNTLVLPHFLLGTNSIWGKATALGLITFFGLLLGMLVQPIAGSFSDQVRPRRGRRGAIALGTALILAALVVTAVSRHLFVVIVGYMLLQAALSVAQAAQQGLIPDLVPINLRGTAAGLKGFMDVGGALLGFILLGELLEAGQPATAIAIMASVLVAACLLTLVLVREPVQRTAAPPRRVTLADTFRVDPRAHRAFVRVVLARFLFLVGTYAVGRFFLFFVADLLGLDPGRATEQAGALLAALTLITILAAPLAGWGVDRFGHLPLMLAGAGLSALGVLLLTVAGTALHILLCGGLMAVGSAAFASANWALTADLVPPAEAARFFGIANIGTAGAAAAAGLFGPLIDWANNLAPGVGYVALFVAAALAFVASAVALLGDAIPAAQSRGTHPAG